MQQGKEEQFRESLRDCAAVIEKLAPHCNDLQEMTELLNLAAGDNATPGNDAQLRILMLVILGPAAREQRGR